MAQLYDPDNAPEQCPTCGSEMSPFTCMGIKFGCKNCMPDKLVAKYCV